MSDDHLGPLFLYSTSMTPHERLMLEWASRRVGRTLSAPIKAVFVQASLPAPSKDEVEKMRRHLDVEGVAVEVSDAGLNVRADAYRPEVIDRLQHADLVLLTGGSPERAHEVMGGTPALTALRAASASGAVIAGCSAGALLMGRGMLTGPPAARHPIDLWDWLPGVLIAPHYGRYEMALWLRSFPGCVVLGIPDGGMALVLHGDSVRSLGPEPVFVIRPGTAHAERVRPGERAMLARP